MIIAIKEKDRVVVAYSNADSKCNLCEKDYVDEENVAIRYSKAGRLYACDSMNFASDKLLYDDSFIENESVNPKAIVCEIIPFIKHTLGEKKSESSKEDTWRNTLLICDGQRVYDIDSKFGFTEIDDYVCHGYREDCLKSVLDATKDLSAEDRILQAVRFTSKLYKEDLFPIVITDTNTKQIKNVYKGEKIDEYFDCI